MKIKKEICRYNNLAHRQGLLPFFENGEKKFPLITDTDGNFGKTVYDFCFSTDKEVEKDEMYFFDKTKEGKKYFRYKSQDFFKNYNTALKLLDNSIVVKRNGKDSEGREIWLKVKSDSLIGVPMLLFPCFFNIGNERYIYCNDKKLNENLLWKNEDFIILLGVNDTYFYNSCNEFKDEQEDDILYTDTLPTIGTGPMYPFVVVINYQKIENPSNKDEFTVLDTIPLPSKTVPKYFYCKSDDSYYESIFNYYELTSDYTLPKPNDLYIMEELNNKWVLWKKLCGMEISESVVMWRYWELVNDAENIFIGRLRIPYKDESGKIIEGDKVPDIISFPEVSELIDWFEKNADNKNDCCLQKEWNRRGGDTLYEYLKSEKVQNTIKNALDYIKGWESNERFFDIPFMDFKIVFEDTFKDLGMMTVYSDESYIPKEDSLLESHRKFMEFDGDGYIESELYKVRNKDFVFDDNGFLPGVFDYNQESYYKITFDSVEKIQRSDIKPSDTWLNAINNENVYYSVSFVEEGVAILKKNATETDFMIVLPTYAYSENGTIMKVPYEKDKIYNMAKDSSGTKCYGDFVAEIEYKDNMIGITYNIGGIIDCETYKPILDEMNGILLYEEYGYKPDSIYHMKLNDLEFDIRYEEMDFESKKCTFYDETRKMTRVGYRAKVLGLMVYDLKGYTNNILFRRNEDLNLTFLPQESIDIDFNRGSAAAFEHHFKLEECNTMEDLENYGNNFFNL